jgi:hypothetical protein
MDRLRSRPQVIGRGWYLVYLPDSLTMGRSLAEDESQFSDILCNFVSPAHFYLINYYNKL